MNLNPKRSARVQFDRQASHYDSQWNRWSEETLQWMLQNAQLSRQTCALDIASGTGFTAMAFAESVGQVVCLDVSAGMLAEAQKNALQQQMQNVAFIQGQAECMPITSKSFDLALCRIAAHHFLSVPAFLLETARILRDGGALVLTDTCVPDDIEADQWQNHLETVRDPSHVRNYTAKEWAAMLLAAGWKVEKLHCMPCSVKINLSDWLKKAGCSASQETEVRTLLNNASPEVKAYFDLRECGDDLCFAWHRVALKAVL